MINHKKSRVEKVTQLFNVLISRKKRFVLTIVFFVGLTVFSLFFFMSRSRALTATILPNGDVTTGWTVLGGSDDASCAGGTHCDRVDEDVNGTPNTADYVSTGGPGSSGASAAEEFNLTTVTGADSVTSVAVDVYAMNATNANGGTLDAIDIQLRIGGSLQTAVRVTPAFNTWTKYTATFNGSWTQSQIDGARILITRVTQGSGNPTNQQDDVRVSAISAVVTYFPPPLIEQASHRWFNDGTNVPDGGRWVRASANAGWGGRYSHAGVEYQGKYWVIAGNENTVQKNDVWSSDDRTNWTQVTAAAAWSAREEPKVLNYNNKLWLIGGYAGTTELNDVWSSSDGITWTQETAAAGWSTRTGIVAFVFNSKMWIMGGDDNGTDRNDVWSSTDGITWTQETAAAGWSARAYFGGIVFNNKMWVMGGSNSTTSLNDVWSSSDGITWTQETAAAGWALKNSFAMTTYDSKMWVLGGEDEFGFEKRDVWSSPDGITWTQATSAASWSSRDGLLATTYDNRLWVIGGYGSSGGYMNDSWHSTFQMGVGSTVAAQDSPATLSSGVTKARLRMNLDISNGSMSLNSNSILKMQYAEMSGASCSNAETYHDLSTAAWTSQTPATNSFWNGVAYGNGLFVAVSSDGAGNRVMTSPDGITWTSRTSAADNSWQSVTYGNGLFVAVASSGTGNRVMTSPDGINWTSRTSAIDNQWADVTYGNGLFVAVADDFPGDVGNRIMTSPDGINWTSRTSVAHNSWTDVTYGNGLFVAVAWGETDRLITSPDGITWTPRTSAAITAGSWRGVTYGNGLFVAVGNNSVMTSPDGITWTTRTSAASNQWWSVTYGNGLFVAVSNSGTGNRAMTSPDGITWTPRTSAADNGWNSATYSNGMFVAVASSGVGNRVMTMSPPISFYGASYLNKSTVTSSVNDPVSTGTVRLQSHQTVNRFNNDKLSITDGDYGLWDFPVDLTNASQATTYCFRAVKDDNTASGTLLDTYSFWPQITTASAGANTAPTAPTLSAPTDTATDVADNPQFQLSATDSDSDYLQYRIEVCSTSNCSSVVRTIDQTLSQTGWSGQNTQTSTAYTSGTTASHTYQAPLLTNTTQYWWRAYAIDPGGTNTWSSASSIFSFTTEAAAPPPSDGTTINGGVEIRGGTSIGQ